MGNNFQLYKTFGEEDIVNKKVNKWMKKQRKERKRQHHIVLLGTGDSGKSTFFRQVRYLNKSRNIPISELVLMRENVYRNIFTESKRIIQQMELLRIDYASTEAEEATNIVNNITIDELRKQGMNEETRKALSDLWNDKSVQHAFLERSEFDVLPCVTHFLHPDTLYRIFSEGKEYLPSFLDCVNVRFRTVGVEKEPLRLTKANKTNVLLYDIGGQRSERHKWMKVLSNVTAIIFVVALSEYDQFLYEDETVARYKESLAVWKKLINNHDFKDVKFLLLMNKSDLFSSKLKHIPFRVTDGPNPRNEDYTGPEPMECQDPKAQEAAIMHCGEFVVERFKQQLEPDTLPSYTIEHGFTSATDTRSFEEIYRVIASKFIQDMFLS